MRWEKKQEHAANHTSVLKTKAMITNLLSALARFVAEFELALLRARHELCSDRGPNRWRFQNKKRKNNLKKHRRIKCDWDSHNNFQEIQKQRKLSQVFVYIDYIWDEENIYDYYNYYYYYYYPLNWFYVLYLLNQKHIHYYV